MINFSINENNLEDFKNLKVNTWLSYTGKIIVFRDQVHNILKNINENKLDINLDLKNKILLYAGPTSSTKPIIGPTTSKRMDEYLDLVLSLGIIATIGKGPRNQFVNNIIKHYAAPYLVLYSGVASYLSCFFKNEKVIAFNELGAEAVREYYVSKLPLFTAIDGNGNSFWN
jgi:fumarate hydratase subunit beta